MSTGPWGPKFVGAHIFLGESGPAVPSAWSAIRFDAVDVLFVSPFFVNSSDEIFLPDNCTEQFQWVIQTARTANPNIKIILEQFWGVWGAPGGFDILSSSTDIATFATSVATFIGGYYNMTLPSLSGEGTVSARIDGWDVDVESNTQVYNLPQILAAVRTALNNLGTTLSATFSVSITPAGTEFFDATMATSCDYVNMQNYSGGSGTTPAAYKAAIPGLQTSQLVWGINSESPGQNAPPSFAAMKAEVETVTAGTYPGVYAWRLDSGDLTWENVFQVWLYNTVFGVTLQGSAPESEVEAQWVANGGSP